MKIEKKDLPKSEVEFTIVVDEATFASYHDKSVKQVQAMVEIDGFRKGFAPENVIVQKYGDMIILEEMANAAMRDAYMQAMQEHKIIPVADPQVTITKLAKGNPLELTITVATLPAVTLPDYTKIAGVAAQGVLGESVTDEDVTKVLEELRKGRAGGTHDHEGHDHDHSHEGHDHDHDHAHEHDTDTKDEAVLPELNDEFAKSFGESFTSLDDLKAKVRENLVLEKEQKTREKKRSAIVEALIESSTADVPQVMVEQELERMLMQMKGDITRYGGTWEEYLKYAKKTEAEIKDSWKQDALKRVMSQLILAEIAVVEKIKPTDEEIEAELVRLLATVQDADEERARVYLHQALTNDKVLAFLEGTK